MRAYHHHVPKTAGKSIKVVLNRNKLGSSTKKHKPIWRAVGDEPEVYTFSVKRNPYDRAVSSFYHLKSKHPYFRELFTEGQNINDFYHLLADDPVAWEKFHKRFLHCKRQIKFLSARYTNEISDKINRILRFENLNQDWFELVKYLETVIPAWNKAPKELHVHKNKSIRKPWQEELDDKSIAAINDFYSLDFELLGYEKI